MWTVSVWAGTQQRVFWSVVLLETGNGAVGSRWDGVGSLEHKGRRLSMPGPLLTGRAGGRLARGRGRCTKVVGGAWEAGKERFWN